MNAVATQCDKTHYRKVFDSPYLSSADITEPTRLTIARVTQEPDKTKKTKDVFNTAHFAERELRKGEKLKPMILNATNSRKLREITGSAYIEDWRDVPVTVLVDSGIKFGRDVVEGLRITAPARRNTVTPSNAAMWSNAKSAYLRDGNLDAVLSRADMSAEHQAQLIAECNGGAE